MLSIIKKQKKVMVSLLQKIEIKTNIIPNRFSRYPFGFINFHQNIHNKNDLSIISRKFNLVKISFKSLSGRISC